MYLLILPLIYILIKKFTLLATLASILYFQFISSLVSVLEVAPEQVGRRLSRQMILSATVFA